MAPVGHGQQHKHRTTAQAQGSTSHHGQQHKHRLTHTIKQNKTHSGSNKYKSQSNKTTQIYTEQARAITDKTWWQSSTGWSVETSQTQDHTDSQSGPHRPTVRPHRHRAIPTIGQPGKIRESNKVAVKPNRRVGTGTQCTVRTGVECTCCKCVISLVPHIAPTGWPHGLMLCHPILLSAAPLRMRLHDRQLHLLGIIVRCGGHAVGAMHVYRMWTRTVPDAGFPPHWVL